MESHSLTTFDKQFLFYVGLGPLILTVLLSILCGIKLRAGWGMPLLSLWGIILLAYIQPHLTKQKFYFFFISTMLLMMALVIGYSLSLINSSSPSSANFPGKKLAEIITKQWHEKYHTPLNYVAGSRWIGGNIGFYSKDHPAVYMEWNHQRAPWIDIENLKTEGAVFVWDLNDNETLPQDVRHQFPRLQNIEVLQFAWHRNKRNIAPIKIGVAWLPPKK